MKKVNVRLVSWLRSIRAHSILIFVGTIAAGACLWLWVLRLVAEFILFEILLVAAGVALACGFITRRVRPANLKPL